MKGYLIIKNEDHSSLTDKFSAYRVMTSDIKDDLISSLVYCRILRVFSCELPKATPLSYGEKLMLLLREMEEKEAWEENESREREKTLFQKRLSKQSMGGDQSNE